MPTNITLKGFKEFQQKLATLPATVKHEVAFAVKDAGNLWEERAKLDAPVDQGPLRSGITNKQTGEMANEVTSRANYSAYIEWGTKSRVKVPADIAEYAAQFRGKGQGDYYDFLNAILDWVKRKGLSNVTNSYTGKKVGGKVAKENLLVLAEAIAFSIMRKGIHPHPFFFIQFPIVEKQLIGDIKQILSVER